VSFRALLRRGGAPVEFYRFQYVGTSDALAKWNASDVGREFLITGAIHPTGGDIAEIYLPAPVTRAEIQGTEERGGAGCSFTVPLDDPETDPIVDLYRDGVSPVQAVEVCAYRAYRGHSTTTRVFYGTITTPEFTRRTCILHCEPKSAAIRLPILRQRYQAPCNNTLYDAFCGVSKASFSDATTVQAVAADGVTLTITDAALQVDGYYGAGGLLQFGSRYGYIREHTGDQVVLVAPVPGLIATSAVTISAGCDRSLGTCTTKFANAANHQGFPFVPTEDPFRHGVRR
jgi:hypothetical protein